MGKTALSIRAGSRRQPSGVRILLELGVGVNATNGTVSTPLHSAAQAKSLENVDTLLEFGADIHTPGDIELVEMAKVARRLLLGGGSRR